MSHQCDKSGRESDDSDIVGFSKKNLPDLKYIEGLRKEMIEAAGNLEFEKASKIRDEVRKLENLLLI